MATSKKKTKQELPPLAPGEVRWTPALTEAAARQAAEMAKVPAAASAVELYGAVRRAVAENSRDRLFRGLSAQTSPELAARTRAALAAYEAETPALPRQLAVEAVAIQAFIYYRSTGVDVVRFLCAQEGVAFALEAFVDSQGYECVSLPDDRGSMLSAASADRFPREQLMERVDRVFHVALAEASADERARARAFAERVRAGGDPRLRALMAAIFLEPAWVNEVLRAGQPGNAVVTAEMILAATDQAARLECLRDGGRSKEFLEDFEFVLLDRERERGADLLGAHLVGMFVVYAASRWAKYALGAKWKPLVEAVQTVVGSRHLVDGQLELLKYFHGEKLAKKEDPRLALLTGVRANAALALTVLRGRMRTDNGVWATELLAELERLASDATAVEDTSLESILGPVGKLPAFWVPAALPRPLVRASGAPLSIATIDALATRLRAGDTSSIAAVRAACEPASLGAFAWGLYGAWLNAGADGGEKWAFEALGHLGDDDVARKLIPLVASWPRESFIARASLGLDALTRIGTPTALAAVVDIAARGHFASLRAHARELLDALAGARGTTAAAIVDRAVPTLGFTHEGGPVEIDSALEPVTEATAALRKELRTLARALAYRLELAMIQERRWTPAEFAEVFVGHPLMRRAARGLVFCAFPRGGGRRLSFSLAADGRLVDASGGLVELQAREEVGLMHPVVVTDAELAAWRARSTRESLPQLFDQIERITFPTSSSAFERWFARPRTVSTASVLGLKARGWHFPSPSVGARVDTITKTFEHYGEVTIVLDPGIDLDDRLARPQQVVSASFLREDWGDRDGWITAADRKIDPMPDVMKSELLKELHSLA